MFVLLLRMRRILYVLFLLRMRRILYVLFLLRMRRILYILLLLRMSPYLFCFAPASALERTAVRVNRRKKLTPITYISFWKQRLRVCLLSYSYFNLKNVLIKTHSEGKGLTKVFSGQESGRPKTVSDQRFDT
jgi:hypothetical protein